MLLEPTVLDPSEIQDVSSAPKSQPVPLDEDDIATESLRDPKAIVRRYATEAGLDPDLVHRLATQESGYNQNAISPKGAIGVMQLMPATAVRLGVNAYNLHQNIQGGVAELKRLVGKYGDVRKALAAYNAGEGAVDKYGGIPPYAETQNYVNTIAGQKPKPVPLDPSQIGSVQQPVALDENDIASIETPKPAPVVNVGAPGRNVGPAMTPDQLAAAEPWRKPTPNVPSYRQVTPEQADKGIARGAYQDRSLRTVYENLALNADVQKAFQQHAPRLAELEAKQKAAEDAAATPHGFEYQQPLTGPENRELASLRQERVNAQEAWQKQVEPQRQDDLISVAKAKWPANDAALAAFVQKHGPLTRDEQKLLGLPTNYLAQLPINIGAGLAQLGLGTAAGFERFVGSPANARDLEKLSGQVNTAEGVFGNQEVPGAVAHAAGGLLPQFALSAALPEFAPALAATGVIDPALFFGTSALEHYGQGASGEESLKAGVESLLPIAGAKFIGALAVGGPVLQMAQRIGGNAFANGLYTAANNGDSKAIATSFLMGGFMGFGHGESMDVPDDMIRAVITNPDIQSGVADILAKPKLFKQAIPKVEAKLKEAGLTDEQASQFTANLKTAAAASPESLAKENQNATALPEDQRVGTEVGQTTQGSEVNRSGNDQQTGNVVGESGATAGRSSGTEENKVASVKAFITRADEAELRKRGYSEDQIYKMKPDEAQRILSNPVEPVNEFESPPKVSTGPVQNKSILEAVRALGRIQVNDETVEGGELRQFGNKEQKGQGLVGPNGKLAPDLMREALEEAGFRDPNSNEPPGTPGSLSLDGMYELMDREQRGDKVYSAHRDSNLVDADWAKEYEQYRESGNEDAQFGHESGLEDEWRNPDSPLRQAYERIISGDDANGDEFVSVAQQYGISPESIEEHIQRATRTRESLPPVEVTPGGNDGRPEVAPEEGRITGIKNAVTDAERAERNLSPIEKDIYDEFPKVFDDVKHGIDSGKIDIRGLTREWAEHPKGLSENEEAALIYDRARLYNNKEEIIDEITSAIASGDKAAEVEARVRLAPIEDAIVANEKAAVRSGTIWGRSGAMRQRMMKADYSLANIERRYRAKTGDSPTAEQSAKFKKLSEDLEDAQRAIAKRDDIISDLEARRWAKTEARKEAASGRRVKRAGSLDAIKKEWDGQKDALVRLLKLQGIGEPPAGGSKGLGGPEAGAVDPNLVTLPADVAKLLIEMARNRIRAGVTDAVDIVDSIHESIKDKFSVSARQISDAISGYGKQSKLSTDEVEVQLREVKRIRRLMSALEDAQKGEAPQRSGLKRDKPTRLVRELTRQVNEALRKNGYKLESADRSPEEQYQSALDGVKTRLRNQIQDLNERIATGRKPEARTPIQRDAEAMALAKERDGLVATLKEIDGPRRMTNEQRVAATEKALEKSIADYDARINEKRFTPDGKPEPATSPRIEQLRAKRDALKKDFDKLKETDPAAMAAKEASALKTYHKQLATREADMTKTLADIKAGTYEPRAKRTQRNDPVSVEARARAGRIQDEIEKELLKAQLAKRNWTDKALDFAVKWRRNMLLSNPLTLAKLATAAASRVVISPVEEAAGGIIGQIPKVSKVAAKAPREGGFSVAAEAKAIYGYTRQLMQFAEAREIVRTGKTRLDTIYGAKGDLPPEAIEFFGRLHKLMKAPAQAAEFARSYQKRVEWALNNKMDPTDPVTQAALASSAYLDAQRAILMQDNAAVTYYRQVISRMRALDSTGKAAHPGYARALEMLLPIVKVPTNFVTETANYSLGLANALLKFRRAGWDANKLTPDEADSIMRSLKKQFVGAGLFALGYGFADKVGGYYQQGEKRKEGAPKAGEVQLFGRNIPHFFLHSPAMEVMQLGATFRHVMDAHADYSTLGKLGSGALAGAAGLSQQVPFIETPATIADAAKSDRKFGKFTANTVGGMVIPPVAKKIAEFQDSGVKRKPGSIGEDIKMMIPSPLPENRKTVPTEEDRKTEKKEKAFEKRQNPDVEKIIERRQKKIP